MEVLSQASLTLLTPLWIAVEQFVFGAGEEVFLGLKDCDIA